MEIARHVFDTYFTDVTNVLVRHHLDSFAYMLDTKITNFILGKNPLSLDLADNRRIDIYIGGKDGKERGDAGIASADEEEALAVRADGE